MRKFLTAAAGGGLGLALVLGTAAPAMATLDMQKKAKELGIAGVTNCQSCHVEKLPKKGAVTNNEMGKWLVDQKEKKGAKEIDVAWLKEYQPPKK